MHGHTMLQHIDDHSRGVECRECDLRDCSHGDEQEDVRVEEDSVQSDAIEAVTARA